MHKTIYILLIIILCSCNSKTEAIKKSPHTELLKSKSFSQARNQSGKLVEFTFQIDSLSKIVKDNTVFYKLNLTAYDSIYIGKSNDTVFSYDQRINFKDVFVILNKEKTSYAGRLGIDFDVSLIEFNDSIFRYSFKKIKNIPEGDHIIMGYEYPELTISKMDMTPNGKVVDLVIEH